MCWYLLIIHHRSKKPGSQMVTSNFVEDHEVIDSAKENAAQNILGRI